MGLVAAAQWPYSLYSGGLMGLQKQVLLNTIRAFMATIQAGGAVLVLWLVSPSVEAYFMWQIGVVAIQTLLTCYFLWASLPKNDNAATFSWDLLGQCWRFAAGAAGISVATMLLAQVDKVILSKLLPLEQFGYYTLAFTIGNALMLLAIPISTALFPNLSELNARGKTEELSRIYHRGCQVVSLLVFPLGTLLALFPREILSLWTRNPGIVENTHLLLSLVSVGCALNAVITIPLILQLSHGWTSLSFYSNMISVVILIPLLFVLIPVLGAIGGAITWVLLNIGYVVFQIPLMHRRIIPKEMLDWYFIDVGLPVACCVVIGMIIKMILPETMTTLMKLSVLVTAFTGMSLACVLVIPSHRAYLAEHIHFH
jgi:O-antigen/teichoic acid export membrane protein